MAAAHGARRRVVASIKVGDWWAYQPTISAHVDHATVGSFVARQGRRLHVGQLDHHLGQPVREGRRLDPPARRRGGGRRRAGPVAPARPPILRVDRPAPGRRLVRRGRSVGPVRHQHGHRRLGPHDELGDVQQAARHVRREFGRPRDEGGVHGRADRNAVLRRRVPILVVVERESYDVGLPTRGCTAARSTCRAALPEPDADARACRRSRSHASAAPARRRRCRRSRCARRADRSRHAAAGRRATERPSVGRQPQLVVRQPGVRRRAAHRLKTARTDARQTTYGETYGCDGGAVLGDRRRRRRRLPPRARFPA